MPASNEQPPAKLRILCLHGFRQSARQFRGRTCALQKRLRHVAELVFVDGPHVLPLWHKQQQQQGEGPLGPPIAATALESRLLEQHQRQEQELQPKDQPAASPAAAGPWHLAGRGPQQTQEEQQAAAAAAAAAAPVRKQQAIGSYETCGAVQPPELPAARRAWLVSPVLMQMQPELYRLFAGSCSSGPAHGTGQQPATAAGCHTAADEAGGTGDSKACLQDQPTIWSSSSRGAGVAPAALDRQQFVSQTHGWDVSWCVIQQAVQELGPFDGLLGFSQGAAVAAVVAALQQEQQQQQQCCQQTISGDEDAASTAEAAAGRAVVCSLKFRFVILCSGFPSPCPEHQQLLSKVAPLHLPSLHIYGSSGGDRQINHELSQRLAGHFQMEGRIVVEHASGHLIPSGKEVISAIREFLGQFLVPL